MIGIGGRFRLLAMMVAIAIVGCSGETDGLVHHSVSGSVSLDGKPLKAGMILFIPDSPKGIAFPTSGRIQDGNFAISGAQDPLPGRHVIRITSPSGSNSSNSVPVEGPLPTVELIPRQYNQESQLAAEVETGGKNQFRFDLTTGSK